MFTYYLKLALLALKRTPALSALMVLAIALGLATAMTSFTLLYKLSGNPIPNKSDVLYAVQVDNWSVDSPFDDSPDNLPPNLMTHGDARRLLSDAKGLRQTAMWRSGVSVVPADKEVRPRLASARVTGGDFFAMFEVPFLHGGGWSKEAEQREERVTVISRELAERVFKRTDVVGQRIRFDDEDFNIVGVLDTWKLQPLFYDVSNDTLGDPEEVSIPWSVGTAKELDINGNINCFEPGGDGFKGLIESDCIFTQYWVELPDAAARAAYFDYLGAYVAEQRKSGRFKRPDNHRLSPVMTWLSQNRVVPDDSRIFTGIGVAFLFVCLLNATGLLLAKFLRKSGEIGLRRALGAKRGAIFADHLTESGLIGFLGAVIGLGMTVGGLALIRVMVPRFDDVAQLDATLFSVLMLVALFGAVMAGAYPAWRACRIAPASQLKTH